MTKDEALDLALEALEQYTNVVTFVNDPNSWETVVDGGKPARDAITAIKQARSAPYVASPRVQEPVGTYGEIHESMQALLRSGLQRDQYIYMAMKDKPLYTAPPAAPAAPVQEPDHGDELTIAYMSGLHDGKKKRQWVGLTEQERNDIEDYCEMIIGKPTFDAIEAKLKEKNNG
jgi:hypothetical protein